MTGRAAETRVCLVTQRWAPSFAGAALRFQQYIPGLREQGISVDVVCSSPPDATSADGGPEWDRLGPGQIAQSRDEQGTHVYHVRVPQGRSLGRNVQFGRAIARIVRTTGVEVVQLLTLAPLRGLYLDGMSRTGARTVFTGTQLWTFSRHYAKRVLQRSWIRIPIQRTDHVVISSDVMHSFYKSLGITVPMTVVPNGVDVDRFRAVDPDVQRSAARTQLGISDEADLVVFIGSIIHRKGVDTLIEAFRQVAAQNPDAELLLVGPREETGAADGRCFVKRIDESVRRSSAAERIHFTGQVPDVGTYLRAADLLVLPSRREGLGNVVLEAMAAGIPAVLTPYLGLPAEFGEPGVQYVLSGPDADSLASSIASLLRDPDRRKAIGKSGQLWVSDHMSISNAINAYARIYRDLAVHGVVQVGGPKETDQG